MTTGLSGVSLAVHMTPTKLIASWYFSSYLIAPLFMDLGHMSKHVHFCLRTLILIIFLAKSITFVIFWYMCLLLIRNDRNPYLGGSFHRDSCMNCFCPYKNEAQQKFCAHICNFMYIYLYILRIRILFNVIRTNLLRGYRIPVRYITYTVFRKILAPWD